MQKVPYRYCRYCKSRSCALIWLALLCLILPACSIAPRLVGDDSLLDTKADAILEGKFLLGQAVVLADLPAVDMLKLTPGMRHFLDTYVRPSRGRSKKVQNLLAAIINPGVLGLQYGETHTRTAAQAFQSLGANCLSFSNLYIALAREVGLKAKYQEVMLPPEEDLQGLSLILRRHVNVIVDGSRGRRHVIDFNPFQQDANSVDAKGLTDEQAFAQYYNNIAMEHMAAGHYKEAYLYLRKAMELERNGAYLWSNMGVLLSRIKQFNYAEAAMLIAVQLKPSERAALTNLATFYDARGDDVKKIFYLAQIEKYRLRNPYYLLIEAKQAYAVGNYERARAVLERAVAIKKSESLFHELLSRTLNELGYQQGAIAAMQQAVDLADTVSQKIRYSTQLSELQRYLASGAKGISGAS